MEKIIRISNKDYKMKASALTQFSYKNETGRSFLNDLKKLMNINISKVEISNIEILDDISDLILRMAYVMIKEADKSQITNYEEFLSGIENLYDDKTWINEVLELAVSPLSRQLQGNKN